MENQDQGQSATSIKAPTANIKPARKTSAAPHLTILIGVVVALLLFGVILVGLLNKSSKVTTTQSPTTPQKPTVKLKTEYKNPFEKETQYVNPFAQYKNPFDNLK